MNLPDIDSNDIVRLIDAWIVGRNAKRNREVLKARLIDGVTFERLAEAFNLSVTQVKRIVYNGTETIFRHMN